MSLRGKTIVLSQKERQMRIQGKIIELGDIVGHPGRLKQNAVMEYDAENHETATLEVCGDERVALLQKLKVGDQVTVEFRGKWHVIMEDYTVVIVDNVRLSHWEISPVNPGYCGQR